MPDQAAYIGRAADLAADPETPAMLARLRVAMRARLQASPVCDIDGFRREMERFYLAAAASG